MTTSFYKQNSNAKILNNLNYTLTVKDNFIDIKNNKIQFQIYLENNEIQCLEKIKNSFYKNYYMNILLVKKALEDIFKTNDEKFHKYINLNIKCSDIYAENAFKNWIYEWFDKNTTNEFKYKTELRDIYDGFKKCKVVVK